MQKIPQVKCWDTGARYVLWCDFCRRWHLHSRYEGHALCHCDTRRPGEHYADGYILILAGPAPKALLRDLRRRRPKGPPECF